MILWANEMRQEIRPTIRKAVQIGFVVLTIGLFLVFFFLNLFSSPPRTPFEKWYGNWLAVVLVTIVFLFFVFFLTQPRRPGEWRGAGLTTAFFISLFTEMFGIPLTIYLLAPLLGVEPRMFGMHESHLWGYLLFRMGVMNIEAGVYLVMVISTVLLVLGFTLLSLGWREVYRGKGELVTTGLYGRLRHPQYMALILIIIAFLIQWPTLLTLLLAPFLIGRYILLAKEEDEELDEKFSEDFRHYKERVSGFIPSLR
jgi:protein-S-isoprenylcysteine O-methyltransferase Ste14